MADTSKQNSQSMNNTEDHKQQRTKKSRFDISELKKDPLYEKALEEAIRIEKLNAKKPYEINFSVQYDTNFGEKVVVAGNYSILGEWNPEKGFELLWSEGNYWKGSLILETMEVPLEYKYVCLKEDFQKWERGLNRVVESQSGRTSGTKIVIENNDTWQSL